MRSSESLPVSKPRSRNLLPMTSTGNQFQQQEHVDGPAPLKDTDTNDKLATAPAMIFLESCADAPLASYRVHEAGASTSIPTLPDADIDDVRAAGQIDEIATTATLALPVFGADDRSTVERDETICLAATQAFPALIAAEAPPDSLQKSISSAVTHPLPRETPASDAASVREDDFSLATTQALPFSPGRQVRRGRLSIGHVLVLAALLLIVILQASTLGLDQFVGMDGWAYVLGGPGATNNQNLLSKVKQQLQHQVTPGTKSTPQVITPQHLIDLLMQNMTLDQKIGQMLLVQFLGGDDSLALSTMVRQENVGAVLLYSANGNIIDKAQLKGLVQQAQGSASIPLLVSIDQEGGTVDRLAALDGPRQSAASIGATNNTATALAAGIQDAKDLTSYGINLNLAPVVDVTNIYNSQLYSRTFGANPAIVTSMAGAYLKGLQQSGAVMGTIKHFPGLGDVGVDPHTGLPRLNRSQSQLEAIDWAPYRALIQQGLVHAVMVTHEMVPQIDNSLPSSLSYKLVTGILRQDLGFQGVIVTDSLTMEGIAAFYTEPQAAVLAIKAGCDLLMGAASPDDVAAMVQGIKQAISAGQLSVQRIDESVRRILMLKFQAGLLHLPAN